jgi:ribosomal protein S21
MPLDRALAKLKKTMAMNGTFRALQAHAFHLKPGERKRLKSERARAKAKKRELQMRDAVAYVDAQVESRKQFGRRIYVAPKREVKTI